MLSENLIIIYTNKHYKYQSFMQIVTIFLRLTLIHQDIIRAFEYILLCKLISQENNANNVGCKKSNTTKTQYLFSEEHALNRESNRKKIRFKILILLFLDKWVVSFS